MIITRTPVRISFLGGGTDYPQWLKASRRGGMVVGGAICQYSFLSVRHLPAFHPFKTKVVYSTIECVQKFSEIEHRSVRAALRFLHMDGDRDPGLEIHHMGDLPGRSGVGSSSTFLVGLLNALSALRNEHLLCHQLADTAIHVEQDMLGETVGCQDQTFAAYGGLNYIRFRHNEECPNDTKIDVYPMRLTRSTIEELEANLLLVFTGVSRTASDVASTYVPSLAVKAAAQERNFDLAECGLQAIQNGNWAELGKLMDEGWAIKKSLSPKVTNDFVNGIYNAGVDAGAFGGKLLGAGGGGCILFVVPPERRLEVQHAMRGLVEIPVRFDFDGSRVVFLDRENVDGYCRQLA